MSFEEWLELHPELVEYFQPFFENGIDVTLEMNEALELEYEAFIAPELNNDYIS
jgi:hypothetical protein